MLRGALKAPKWKRLIPGARLKALFAALDADANRVLDAEEIRGVFAGAGTPIAHADAAALLARLGVAEDTLFAVGDRVEALGGDGGGAWRPGTLTAVYSMLGAGAGAGGAGAGAGAGAGSTRVTYT